MEIQTALLRLTEVLDKLTVLRAPVPNYQNTLSHRDEEAFTRIHGPTIPSNYFDRFSEMLNQISERFKSQIERELFTCDIMHATISRTGLGIMIHYIVIRPCAQKHGFYRTFLQHIRTIAKAYQLLFIGVLDCTEANGTILKRMNFENNERNYFFSVNDPTVWDMPKTFPTSEQLNSQTYVDSNQSKTLTTTTPATSSGAALQKYINVPTSSASTPGSPATSGPSH